MVAFKKYSYFISICLFFLCQLVYAERPFIVDTDMGVDDAIALLYLLQQPTLKIQAITISSNAGAHCEPARRHVLGLLQMVKYSKVPVACGSKVPLVGQHHFPAFVLQESDTLGGLASQLPSAHQIMSKMTAADLIINTVQKSSAPITILAIGSLTNIAQALQKSPTIKNRIKAIYIMGGALHVPGNLSEIDNRISNKTAEWNIYIDPLAADIVFKQKIPIVLLPLDVTNQLPIDLSFYEQLKREHHTPAANYIFQLLKHNINLVQTKKWYFWDPLAAVIADDPSIAKIKTQPLRIILAPEIKSGSILIDHVHGTPIQLVINVDKNRFKKLLLTKINLNQQIENIK